MIKVQVEVTHRSGKVVPRVVEITDAMVEALIRKQYPDAKKVVVGSAFVDVVEIAEERSCN